MSDFYPNECTRFVSYGATTSGGTTITASASGNTKGSYTEITAATAFNAQGIIVCLGRVDVIYNFLVDIAIGAAGSEVVIVSNIPARSASSCGIDLQYFLPIAIPSGTRISARCQCTSGGSITIQCSIIVIGNSTTSTYAFSGVDIIGPNVSTTDPGVGYLTTGTSNDTKSPWQELTASTSKAYKAVTVVLSNYIATNNTNYLVDIGVGASSSEVVLIPDISGSGDTTAPAQMNFVGPLPCAIPSGTRISFREAVSSNGAVNYIVVAIFGFY